MKRNKPRTIPVGTISEGTLRPEDLIPEYLWTLRRVRLSRPERQTVREVSARWRDGFERTEGDYSANDDVTALEDILSNHVPPYCYFGSTEGDGACFGVWPSIESLERDMDEEDWKLVDSDRNGGGTRVSPDGRWRYVVSDHGNATLYRNGREVWSVV